MHGGSQQAPSETPSRRRTTQKTSLAGKKRKRNRDNENVPLLLEKTNRRQNSPSISSSRRQSPNYAQPPLKRKKFWHHSIPSSWQEKSQASAQYHPNQTENLNSVAPQSFSQSHHPASMPRGGSASMDGARQQTQPQTHHQHPAKEQESIQNQAKVMKLFAKGVRLYKEGKQLQSKECFKHILRIQPNHKSTLYNLGVVYGALKQQKKAIYYFEQSAKFGYRQALHRIGLAYKHGRGVPRDIDKAVYYLTKAADANCTVAMVDLGHLYSTQLENFEMAYELYKRASSNSITGIFNLGTLYERGLGTERSMTKAMKCYIKAAEKEHVDACFNLGVFFEFGRGNIDIDFLQSLRYYRIAAQNGDDQSKECVRLMTEKILSQTCVNNV